MTVNEAITRADAMKQSNAATQEMKLQWLTRLDQTIVQDVLQRHEQDEAAPAVEYTDENTAAELIAPPPHDIIYIYWLMAQIDLAAQELKKYNADIALFQDAYLTYQGWYRRTHRPVRLPPIRLGGDWR